MHYKLQIFPYVMMLQSEKNPSWPWLPCLGLHGRYACGKWVGSLGWSVATTELESACIGLELAHSFFPNVKGIIIEGESKSTYVVLAQFLARDCPSTRCILLTYDLFGWVIVIRNEAIGGEVKIIFLNEALYKLKSNMKI